VKGISKIRHIFTNKLLLKSWYDAFKIIVFTHRPKSMGASQPLLQIQSMINLLGLGSLRVTIAYCPFTFAFSFQVLACTYKSFGNMKYSIEIEGSSTTKFLTRPLIKMDPWNRNNDLLIHFSLYRLFPVQDHVCYTNLCNIELCLIEINMMFI
jgi:hypothetical protein